MPQEFEAPAGPPANTDAAITRAENAFHKRIIYLIWLVLKNVIGWALILAAGPIGVALPGPGGLPLFLIGFAMITFPGKRALTSRVLRGRALDPNGRWVLTGVSVISLFMPLLVLWLLSRKFEDVIRYWGLVRVALAYAWAIAISWLGLRFVIPGVNVALRYVPPVRRKVRPWLHSHGIRLLPPRRRQRLLRSRDAASSPTHEDFGILEVDDRYHRGLKSGWKRAKPWVRRIAGLAVIVLTFGWMIRKISLHWDQVRDRASTISPWNFILAATMFATFLLVFRALAWRHILRGFGHRLPVGASVRIWSTSELARYLPGVIWQVAGRVYLVKPYGVSGSVCAASQVLELVIFLLANILVGLGCLLFFGAKYIHGNARVWLIVVAALIPVLLLLLHPKVFYGAMGVAMRKLKKTPPAQRLAGSQLPKLLIWSIIGLLWQSLAVWLIVSTPLGLPAAKWYVVAGAYCLSWCAGFLAVLNPGGLGVREPVFVAAMMFALPPAVRAQFSDAHELTAFLWFLSGLLRLWTIAGELILASLSYLVDYRGALGRHNAAGVNV